MGSSQSKHYEITYLDEQDATKKGKTIYNGHVLLIENIFTGNDIANAIKIIQQKMMYLKFQMIPEIVIKQLLTATIQQTDIISIIDNAAEFEQFLLVHPKTTVYFVAQLFGAAITCYSDEQIANSLYSNSKNGVTVNIKKICDALDHKRCYRILNMKFDSEPLFAHIYDKYKEHIYNVVQYIDNNYTCSLPRWHKGTLLHMACTTANTKLVEEILKLNKSIIYSINEYGLTPVHMYFLHNSKSISTPMLNLFDMCDLTPILLIKIKANVFTDIHIHQGGSYIVNIKSNLSFNDLINGHDDYVLSSITRGKVSKNSDKHIPTITAEQKKILSDNFVRNSSNIVVYKQKTSATYMQPEKMTASFVEQPPPYLLQITNN